MNEEREKQILASLYDRLLDAVTYSPDGKAAPFRKQEISFQMAKNQVLNPKDFSNMLSPSAPKGDMRAAYEFAQLVDAIPKPGPLWADSGAKVSETYARIAKGAITSSKPSEEQEEIYRQAYEFLNTKTETFDFRNNKKIKVDPSDIAIAYDNAQADYVAAVAGYRTAFNGYDLEQQKDQRAWNAVAPTLQLNINKAWNTWVRSGKQEVEEAQNALVSTINDAVRQAIEQAQELVSDSHQFAPLTATGHPWLPSYALPTNWYDESLKGSKLSFNSSYLNKSSSSEAQTYGAKVSGSWGLWHASAGVEGSNSNEKSHMDAENLTIEAELIAVSIKRPWFNPLLFSMTGWTVNGFNEKQISNGDPADPTGLMPLVPTGFVVARNVKITADFSSEDQQTIKSAISTEAEGGWGPFSISGKYGRETADSTLETKFDGATLTLPGLQLIAWISAVLPASPPMAVAGV